MTHESVDEMPPLSYWRASIDLPDFPALDRDLNVDVVVIGGGITGITAAYLLCRDGLNVALLEADRLMKGTTGHTTAKITAQHGLIYHELTGHMNRDKARLYYDASMGALHFIKETIRERKIECDFAQQDAFVYTTTDKAARQVEREYQSYASLGIDGALVDRIPFAIPVRNALCMKGQAQFHPLRYLDSLVSGIRELGGQVFEHTLCVAVKEGARPTVITRGGWQVSADFLLIGTHFPFYDALGFYFARMQAERSYVVAVAAKSDYPGGMYISADNPSRSLRSAPLGDRTMVLIGGEGHRTGDGGDTLAHYRALETFGAQVLDRHDVLYRWSAQDLTTLDNVAYIGEITASHANILVATGYRKWGMTTGTTAALLLRDIVIKRDSPYRELYRPSRFYADPALKRVVVQNAVAAGHLVKGKWERPARRIDDLAKGEGAVVTFEGGRAGAYQDDGGQFHVVDTTCTHMGCEVVWNRGDRTWDCPCHGSRFSFDGAVVEGPAKSGLKRLL